MNFHVLNHLELDSGYPHTSHSYIVRTLESDTKCLMSNKRHNGILTFVPCEIIYKYQDNIHRMLFRLEKNNLNQDGNKCLYANSTSESLV